MTHAIAALEAAELALVAGGETEGGCIDPQTTDGKDPIQKPIDDMLKAFRTTTF